MRKTFLLILLVAITGIVSVLPSSKAQAVSGSEFQAGRIMDDSVFFGADNIGTNDIQAFLNAKVPVCDTNGTQMRGGTTRAAYGTSQGSPPPYTCLKDYTQNTPSRGAEAGLCNAYSGGSKSAAQIIYDVGVACGVNPRIILVLLQKEQSLVTDDWPWDIQYRSATGYGCPDTAPCDEEYYGFFNQVYHGARQFKRYQRDASFFRYRTNRDNFIQYNPNAACGGTNVFIQNQATAGLYNYTPYQPNAAALANMYGTGDGCSAYGNRNFWRMFNDWFGSVNGAPYSWQLVSQEAYTDAARTQPFTNTTTLQPGAKAYMRIKARNNGYLPWEQSFMNLGTTMPRDRGSAFSNSDWLNSARPTRMTNSQVAPSGVGTFDFTITAPSSPGTYKEYFGLVAEGKTWLNDIGFHYEINVVNSVAAPNPPHTTLASGASLPAKKSLLSPDGQSMLIPQSDGNLVLYSDYRPVWNLGSAGRPPGSLIMQSDGNLVLYDGNGQAVWSSQTNGNPGATLKLQIDGNLVIYSQGGSPLWWTGTVHNPNYLNYVNTTLHQGKLHPGQWLQTADRKYKLILQGDGNLVIYSPNRATWSSNTHGKGAAYLSMQGDGNLVLYNDSNQPLWHAGTGGRGVSRVTMQQDGNLVTYDGLSRPTWHTQTMGQQ